MKKLELCQCLTFFEAEINFNTKSVTCPYCDREYAVEWNYELLLKESVEKKTEKAMMSQTNPPPNGDLLLQNMINQYETLQKDGKYDFTLESNDIDDLKKILNMYRGWRELERRLKNFKTKTMQNISKRILEWMEELVNK